MRRTQAGIAALLAGVAITAAGLATDVLLGPRIGPPLWTCTSNGSPTAARVPAPSGDPSIATFEVLVSHSDCTDRVGGALALVTFVTSALAIYRRASRQG